MAPNLRVDGSFCEDVGWHAARNRYQSFREKHANGKPLAYFFSDALFYGNTCHHHCDRDCADDDV